MAGNPRADGGLLPLLELHGRRRVAFLKRAFDRTRGLTRDRQSGFHSTAWASSYVDRGSSGAWRFVSRRPVMDNCRVARPLGAAEVFYSS